MRWQILEDIYIVLENRRDKHKTNSYVSNLMDRGLESILGKIDEEATELVEASKEDLHNNIVHEAADLIFHTLVLLVYKRVPSTSVPEELRRRRQRRSRSRYRRNEY